MDETIVAESPGGRLMAALSRTGADAQDTAEIRLQKTMLVASTLTMASLGVIWGGIYAFLGEYAAAAIPWTYTAISFASIALFASLKRYRFFRFSQLLFSLILPFVLMVELGGFVESSAVVLWSLTCPLGALVFAGRRQAVRWFAAYVTMVGLGVVYETVPHARTDLPSQAIILLFLMNIVGVSGLAMMLLQYFVGERNFAIEVLDRKHRWIRRAFSSYVSPNLVRYLIDHPESLTLGGERRTCSFVLTDLADFTPLVERTDPEIVVSTLNNYLEGMTGIVFNHDGTIDRIVGDAVSVMFSAPVAQPDHAARAVACALAMDAFAQAFAKRQRAAGLPFGDTRIGVNTGPVIVGNVGSASRLDYRALGDTINTAARLESANRHLGTRVLISETTKTGCPDVPMRAVGTLMLKGKTKGIQTYEPVLNGATGNYKAAYDLMASESTGALAAFETLAEGMPDDPLTAFHVQRLRTGETGATIMFTDK